MNPSQEQRDAKYFSEQKDIIDQSLDWLDKQTEDTFEQFEEIEDCFTEKCEEKRKELLASMNLYMTKLASEKKLVDKHINTIESSLEKNVNMNSLNKTRTYLVGHMQYANGRNWREYVEQELGPLGIRIFNPYKKPFVKDVNEDEAERLSVAHCMEHGYFNDVADRMKLIRSYDLNLVDRSDFIIAHLLPEVASWGSAEEIVTAVRMKKPIFVSMEGGKTKTPLWMMGMLPHHYIYDSIEEAVEMVKRIDDGSKQIDSDRWRLLKENLR